MIQKNILTTFKVVSNCTVTKVVKGSVLVDNTVAFTGTDQAAARDAQAAVATALRNPTDTSVFGNTYGSIDVSGVSTPDAANPSKCLPHP